MISEKGGFRISIFWILIHILLGIGVVKSSAVADLWSFSTLILGLYFIIKNRDKGGEVALWCVYLAAQEVIMRIVAAGIGYEAPKYAIILFIIVGEVLYPYSKRKNYIWIIALTLLIPSLFVTTMTIDRFNSIRGTAIGVLVLLFAAYYFQYRKVTWEFYTKILAWMLLPLLSMVVVLVLKTPDFSDITFTTNSTFETTGGFGPIHISTLLGIGILVTVLLILYGNYILHDKWITYSVFFLMIFRLLLSFARSGLFALVGSFFLAVAYMMASKQLKISRIITYLIVGFIAMTVLWIKVNDLTGSMAYNRYTGRNTMGEAAEDITTGRTDLLIEDMQMFQDNIVFGVGVGNVTNSRIKNYNKSASSHTEFSRLIVEHGLFGLFVVLIITLTPLMFLRETTGRGKTFFIAFVMCSILSMIPAAAKTALPMFIYGLAFLKIDSKTYLS